jgi:hypothetical protein
MARPVLGHFLSVNFGYGRSTDREVEPSLRTMSSGWSGRPWCDGRGDTRSDLFAETAPLIDYDQDVARFFSRIRLVHKLRETRALADFTLVLPPDGSLTSNRLQRLKLDERAIEGDVPSK